MFLMVMMVMMMPTLLLGQFLVFVEVCCKVPGDTQQSESRLPTQWNKRDMKKKKKEKKAENTNITTEL